MKNPKTKRRMGPIASGIFACQTPDSQESRRNHLNFKQLLTDIAQKLNPKKDMVVHPASGKEYKTLDTHPKFTQKGHRRKDVVTYKFTAPQRRQILMMIAHCKTTREIMAVVKDQMQMESAPTNGAPSENAATNPIQIQLAPEIQESLVQVIIDDFDSAKRDRDELDYGTTAKGEK